MLDNRKFTLTAEAVVDEKPIAMFGAIIIAETGKIQFTTKHINETACEEYRDIVRVDRAAFEDFVYDLKNDICAMLSNGEATEEVADA
jgi:hypothetical protein